VTLRRPRAGPPGGGQTPALPRQGSDGRYVLLDCPVEVRPPAPDPAIRLAHPPRRGDRTGGAIPAPPELRHEAPGPARDRRLRGSHATPCLGQVTPQETSTAYLYLRAFHQWNAVVRNADEEQLFREFALALIVATFFIETRTDRRAALEEVAYKVLGYDPALREVSPPLREAFERAMRV